MENTLKLLSGWPCDAYRYYSPFQDEPEVEGEAVAGRSKDYPCEK